MAFPVAAMSHASLFEVALAEQEARNCAAIAAIRARQSDINELQRLNDALGSRGLKVRGDVWTTPNGTNADCLLQLFVECTRTQLTSALEWLAAADITSARLGRTDDGTIVYSLGLRGQEVRLNVSVAEEPAKLLHVFASVF